jgi:ribonuclease HII
MDRLFYEKNYWAQNYHFIAGTDEAGRGPLAGPVVSAAVILKQENCCSELNDSKVLSDKKRRKLSDWIVNNALAVGVGVVWQKEIDQINILNAALKTMSLAIDDLKIKPDFILVDGNRCPDFTIPCKAIIGGDGKSLSIAAASIIAKVTRDDIMIELNEIYPQYNFVQNKGYPTREHREAIKKYGPCPLHRNSFRLVPS